MIATWVERMRAPYASRRAGREDAARAWRRSPSTSCACTAVGCQPRRTVRPIARVTAPKGCGRATSWRVVSSCWIWCSDEQHDALTGQQHRAGRDQRIALDRRHRRRPAEARQQRIEMPPQRRVAPRRDPRKARQRGERRCAAAGQRMPSPHHDRQRVLEQVFLHDVLVRDGITQGADQHVGGAAAQGAEHALVRPVQDSEPVLGPHARRTRAPRAPPARCAPAASPRSPWRRCRCRARPPPRPGPARSRQTPAACAAASFSASRVGRTPWLVTSNSSVPRDFSSCRAARCTAARARPTRRAARAKAPASATAMSACSCVEVMPLRTSSSCAPGYARAHRRERLAQHLQGALDALRGRARRRR